MIKKIVAQSEAVVIGADVHMNKHVVTAKVGKELGWYSAAIIATEVADFKAFDNSDAFVSYIGVVPREASSGETTKRRRITKAGNRRLIPIRLQTLY